MEVRGSYHSYHVFFSIFTRLQLWDNLSFSLNLKLADRLPWLTSKSKNAALCLPHLWDYEGFPPHLAFSIGPEIHRKDLMLSRQVLFRLSHFPSFAYAHLILSNAILFFFFLEFVTKKRYIKKKVSLCVTVQQIKALMDKPNCRCLVINPYGGNKNVIPTPSHCTLTSTGKDKRK